MRSRPFAQAQDWDWPLTSTMSSDWTVANSSNQKTPSHA